MEVKLDKRYPVAAGAEAAWTVLRDIRAVAACMPGAQVTEQVDATHYKGTVKSRIGPAVMSFGGDVELQEIDAPTRLLRLLAKGADKSGSSASMQLTARVEPGADSGVSVLAGQATIAVSGKLAQFGNRLLVPVSDAMLQQFADNFGAAAQRAAAASATPPDASPTAAPGDPVAPSAASESSPASAGAAAAADLPGSAAVVSGTGALGSAEPAAPRDRIEPAPLPPGPARELNALALLWTVFKGWLKGLFRRGR